MILLRHHTQYKYHHGFFDGVEREFRGFGMVETLDTKEFEKYEGTDQGKHYVKPVLTKTWFHGGAFIKAGVISKHYESEYYLGDDEDSPNALPDTIIQDSALLTTEELREAHRALKTKTLRQEVWEWDPDINDVAHDEGEIKAPYTVAESNFTVHCVQPQGDNKHAVFRVDPRETLTWHFEQNPTDPRVAHNFTLQVDDYGNIEKTCAVVYPRQGTGHPEEQTKQYATCAVNSFISKDPNKVPADTFYMIGVPRESASFELGDLGTPTDDLEDIKTQVNEAIASPVPFDQQPTSLNARRLSWQRFKYWNESQGGVATDVTDKALPHHVETAVFTPGLITQAFGINVTGTMLSDAGYVDADGHYWNPGLIQHYSIGDFYLPIRTEDPFGNSVSVTYDTYKLAPISTTDALGNTASAEIDYRTLSPWKLIDPNDNTSEAITDPLGMVIATSIYGYENADLKGDLPLFDATNPYVVQTMPAGDALRHVVDNQMTYLQNATTFFYYDLEAWSDREEPPQAIGLARETHGDPSTKVQISLTYSDGFGREIQSKIFAEPGLAWVKQPDDTYQEQEVTERWLSSGRTVFNNKEKPVKQYEPFYTDTEKYQPEEFFAEYGVTPVIHYDPLLRVIKTDLPDGHHTKVEFSPWLVKTFDQNDTKTGHDHFNTPAIAHLDTLGRQYKTEAYLADADTATPDDILTTTTAFDITSKPLSVTDPRQYATGSGIKAFEYIYDMLGNTLRTVNIDAGDDRVFANIMGNPVASFDSRGHKITATYDVLHRPIDKKVEGNGLDNIVEQLTYGESLPTPEVKNLRGQLVEHKDQSGVTTVALYDIKGQSRQSSKQLRTNYKDEVNWAGTETLETEAFNTESFFDALGRVTEQHNPDGSIVKPGYHQSGRLNTMDAQLKSETTDTAFVTGITYNAKSQREKITYGNNTETTYEYEPETFRLTKLDTRKTAAADPLQDISYVYDPVGNITKIRDDSHNRVFSTTGVVEPEQTYTYDALYRLSSATGRMHNTLGKNAHETQAEFKANAHLNDLTQLSEYTRTYTYDNSGNLHTLQQTGTNPFTRYIKIAENSNRALLNTDNTSTDIIATPAEIADYFDANGNQKKLDHLNAVSWNYRDNISSATIIERTATGNHDAEYYTYDAAGQRTRKVKETFESGETVKRIEEKIYLGGVEIKRIKTVNVATSVETQILDRSDLHIMDDKQRIAIINHWTRDDLLTEIENTTWLNANRQRYQYSNHLGSASLELNTTGDLISYEEYYPYGGTSFTTGANATEVKLKEYRYTGKERDDSTGLYYYGARYYALWLARWMSADPAGPVDGLNLYVYVSNNPIRKTDPTGLNDEDMCTDQCTMEPMEVTGDVASSDVEATGDAKVESDIEFAQTDKGTTYKGLSIRQTGSGGPEDEVLKSLKSSDGTEGGADARKLPGEVGPEDFSTQSSMPDTSEGWSQQGVESLMKDRWSGVVKDLQQRGWEVRAASSITEQADVLTNNPSSGWSYDSAEMDTNIVGLTDYDQKTIFIRAGLSNEDAASTLVHEWTHTLGHGEDVAYKAEMMFQKDIGISQTFSSDSAIQGHIQSNYVDPYSGYTRSGNNTFYKLQDNSFKVNNSWTVWGRR